VCPALAVLAVVWSSRRKGVADLLMFVGSGRGGDVFALVGVEVVVIEGVVTVEVSGDSEVTAGEEDGVLDVAEDVVAEVVGVIVGADAVVVGASGAALALLFSSVAGDSNWLSLLPHLSQKNFGDFCAKTFRSFAGMSSAPMAPSPFVGMKEINATRTVRMLQDGCQCSG